MYSGSFSSSGFSGYFGYYVNPKGIYDIILVIIIYIVQDNIDINRKILYYIKLSLQYYNGSGSD
jgi:hypothetical protein